MIDLPFRLLLLAVLADQGSLQATVPGSLACLTSLVGCSTAIKVTESSQGLSLQEFCRSDAEFEPFQSGSGMHEAAPASEAL